MCKQAHAGTQLNLVLFGWPLKPLAQSRTVSPNAKQHLFSKNSKNHRERANYSLLLSLQLGSTHRWPIEGELIKKNRGSFGETSRARTTNPDAHLPSCMARCSWLHLIAPRLVCCVQFAGASLSALSLWACACATNSFFIREASDPLFVCNCKLPLQILSYSERSLPSARSPTLVASRQSSSSFGHRITFIRSDDRLTIGRSLLTTHKPTLVPSTLAELNQSVTKANLLNYRFRAHPKRLPALPASNAPAATGCILNVRFCSRKTAAAAADLAFVFNDNYYYYYYYYWRLLLLILLLSLLCGATE